MRIKRIVPRADITVERTFAGTLYRLKVVNSPNGLVYVLNGHTYETPTAAAKSITKFEVNGWRFWHMEKE